MILTDNQSVNITKKLWGQLHLDLGSYCEVGW